MAGLEESSDIRHVVSEKVDGYIVDLLETVEARVERTPKLMATVDLSLVISKRFSREQHLPILAIRNGMEATSQLEIYDVFDSFIFDLRQFRVRRLFFALSSDRQKLLWS